MRSLVRRGTADSSGLHSAQSYTSVPTSSSSVTASTSSSPRSPVSYATSASSEPASSRQGDEARAPWWEPRARLLRSLRRVRGYSASHPLDEDLESFDESVLLDLFHVAKGFLRSLETFTERALFADPARRPLEAGARRAPLDGRNVVRTCNLPFSVDAGLTYLIHEFSDLVNKKDLIFACERCAVPIEKVRHLIARLKSWWCRWRAVLVSSEPLGTMRLRSEIHILTVSSFVNGLAFPPYVRELDDDASEKKPRRAWGASASAPYEDLDAIHLSQQQHLLVKSWARPSRNTRLIQGETVEGTCLQQGHVPDCSLICSLVVLAEKERREGTELVTKTFLTRDRAGARQGGTGEYSLKFHWNGVERLVRVDDRLPVCFAGNKLGADSKSRNELWVAILEKAFLKLVSHGYDCWTGSNSCIDIHALTGWMPESLPLRTQNYFLKQSMYSLLPNGPGGDNHKTALEAYSKHVWSCVRRGFAYGDNLLTATTKAYLDERRTGLTPGHVYAVLDIKETPLEHNAAVNKVYLKMKNPWGDRAPSHYRPPPEARHTENLPSLSEDEHRQRCFWIEENEVVRNFASVHINWNPEILPCVITKHCSLNKLDVSYHYALAEEEIGESTQLHFEVDTSRPGALMNAVPLLTWIHVTRHVKQKANLVGSDDHTFALYILPWSSSDTRGAERFVFPTRGFFADHAQPIGVHLGGEYWDGPHHVVSTELTRFTLAITKLVPNQDAVHLTLTVRSTHCCRLFEAPSLRVNETLRESSEINPLWRLRLRKCTESEANSAVYVRISTIKPLVHVSATIYCFELVAGTRARCVWKLRARASPRGQFALLCFHPNVNHEGGTERFFIISPAFHGASKTHLLVHHRIAVSCGNYVSELELLPPDVAERVRIGLACQTKKTNRAGDDQTA